MSLGGESRGRRSFETSHSSSSNCGGRGRRSIMTSHSASRNFWGYFYRVESRSQDTGHSYYRNRGTRVDVEGRGGYRYPTSHYSLPNQGECGIFLLFQEIRLVVMRELYIDPRLATILYKIRYSRSDSARHGRITEEIKHCSLFYIVESVYCVGSSGSRYRTIPSSSHHSSDKW